MDLRKRKRRISVQSLTNSKTHILETDPLNPKMTMKKPKSSRISTARTRPYTITSDKATISASKCRFLSRQNNKIDSFYMDVQLFDQLTNNNKKKIKTLNPFLTKMPCTLNLCEQTQILQEDAYKLQNLITGGYSCEDDFMSLCKFNRAKEDFDLLKQIYNNAKVNWGINQIKGPLKTRNIYSVMYLNQNSYKMQRKEKKGIYHKLKITD